MIALIRLILRLTWLALFALGLKRTVELLQGEADQLINRIEEGESGTAERIFARIHEALHHRQSHHTGGEDPFGEM